MRARWTSILGALAVVGCSLLNAPGDHEAQPIAAADFCTAVAAEFCRGYVECCPAPAAYDVEACVVRRAAQCEEGASVVLYDPITGYDPDAAGVMLAEAHAYVTACDPNLVAWYGSREGLFSPFLGTIAPGGVCSSTATPVIASFLACNDPEQTCRFSATNWSCSARVDVGALCATEFDCVAGAFCETETSRCAPLREDGDVCATVDGAECLSGVCFDGSCTTPERRFLYCSFGS